MAGSGRREPDALPANDKAPLTVVLESDSERTLRKPDTKFKYFYFDQFSGELLQTWENAEPTAGDVFMSWIILLHIGNFAGVGGKILWVLLGLIPALLAVTGTVMWWNRVVAARWRKAAAETRPSENEMINSRITMMLAAFFACSAAAFAQTSPAAPADTSDPFHPKTNVVVTTTRSELEVDKTPYPPASSPARKSRRGP